MNIFKNLKGHFCTITHHKMLVMKTCFKVGLYKQGLLHDLSKYTPIEFIPGIIYYQGDRSPINREKELKNCSRGWLHHKGRNLHHFEYWIDYSMPGSEGPLLIGMKMPLRYVVEMFMDRIAACKVYQKERYTDASPWLYHQKSKRVQAVMHPESLALLNHLLQMLAEEGEKKTFAYAKQLVQKDRISRWKKCLGKKQGKRGE